MTEQNNDITKKITSAFQDATPRVLATQFLELTRDPVVDALCDAAGIRGAQRGAVKKFMGGKVGSALLRLGIGKAIPFIPVVPQRYREALVREYEISAAAEIGNAVAGVFARPIAKIAGTFFESIDGAQMGIDQQGG